MVNLMSAQNNFLINQASKHISIADNGGMKFGSMIPLVGFIFDVTSLTLLDSANNTLDVLQEKINSYLDFVEGDQIIESYPQAIGKQFVIQVVFKYSPSSDGILFLNEVENILKENGYVLHYYVLTNED